MKLVIVESPAKCKTIKRYLGNDYEVIASLGHICDLATSGKYGLGVDVNNNFTPSYIINKNKYSTVEMLKDLASKADEVILATDPDREGEAIAWHLARVLKLNLATTKRLEFHEITRASITEAMANPRRIDERLVASQETRRILDRIIGFRLSTLLYKKIHSRSAGRVQSATLKIISDHDIEIENFVSEEYWNILTSVNINDKKYPLTFAGLNGKSVELTKEEDVKKILDQIPEKLKVISVKKSFRFKESKEPFTTSTLQQEAFARLKFKTKKTSMLAQKLYEGIDVGDEHMGLITYTRTDSTRFSPTYIARAKDYILEAYGAEYLADSTKHKKHTNNDLAQDAHEAIRPTANHRTPESVKKYLSTDQYNLYKLIYSRAIASLMKPKKEEVLTILFGANNLTFKLELVRTVFKGYEIILQDLDEEETKHTYFPDIKEGDYFTVLEKSGEQKFTQPPAHYSEAKIVKIMEEVGIGRPSTYVSTIDTLQKRKYVSDNSGILQITNQGRKTARVLEKYFPEIIDVNYTAQMEEKLDDIQVGSESRVDMLSSFYEDFEKLIASAEKNMYIDEPVYTGDACPKCGSPLIFKEGVNGTFVGCSNFPKCEYVKKEQKVLDVVPDQTCPKCGSALVYRQGKDGKKFVACSSFPQCKYTVSDEKVETIDEKGYIKDCPECDGHLIKKKGRKGYFLGCSNYPKCNHMEQYFTKKKGTYSKKKKQ